MGARYTTVGQVFVVRWEGQLTLGDQEAAVRALREARARMPGDAVMVAILGADLEPPSAEARKGGLDVLRKALGLAVALEIVVGGRGLLGTLQRSTARTAVLLAPDLRGRVHVHERLEDALTHAATLVPLDRAALVAALDRDKLR